MIKNKEILTAKFMKSKEAETTSKSKIRNYKINIEGLNAVTCLNLACYQIPNLNHPPADLITASNHNHLDL